MMMMMMMMMMIIIILLYHYSIMSNLHLLWIDEVEYEDALESQRSQSSIYTLCESAGWECKAERKNPVLISFAPKANLRNSLWWGRMEMWKYASFRSIATNQSSDLVWDTTCSIESILNFSRMTEQFSWLRSKIGRNHPSFLGTMKYRL